MGDLGLDTELDHLRRVLTEGGDINDEDSYGRTRLRRAVAWPDLPVVKLLVELGVDIHAKDKDGRQAIHHAAHWSQAGSLPGSFDARVEIIEVLLAAGADLDALDDNGDTPLSLASSNGRASSVQYLLHRGANPLLYGTYGCITPEYIIDFFCNLDELDAASTLQRVMGNINEKGEDGYALIHRAAWLGSAPAVLGLLMAGAQPNSCGRHGLRPLHFTAELMNHPNGANAINALVRLGADVNAKNAAGYTPLLIAARNGSPPAVRILLKHGADAFIPGDDGYSPLHYAFALMGHPEGKAAIEALLRLGLSVDSVKDRLTPLLRAAFRGSTSAVHILLKRAVPTAFCHFDSNLVQFAAELMRDGDEACAETISVLLRTGTKSTEALYEFAVSVFSFPLLKVLIEEGPLVRCIPCRLIPTQTIYPLSRI